uniref:DNA polymerase zeta catalytic subunit n=1 Tax=Culicoides sonorensis TaxID=179676 RepID=A0A336M6X9_CULSO
MDKTVEAIRIVTIDFYLTKPIQGLDSCYSELQNTVIKQVPIIRIFGSNKDGNKVCAHIHGVFPYLYIPFDEKEVDNTGKYFQQLACSLDKAINISLGKGESVRQYVYKILLVKGIPFYGFHEKEVHFLKIYLYHPGLIKRVANLLLNGAIMNKSFQPHESHIPYILQFMIDHNLYGMSQVFVPQELIIHRNENSSETDALQKLTLSSIEFDMMAVHILNRALLYQKNDSNCVNPGIASLWEDEKIRRGCNTTSELEPPLSQIRDYVKLSRSDEYFREILKSKLSERLLSDTIIEDQMNSTAEMERLIVMDCEANEVEPQSKSQKSKSSQSGSLFSSSGSERHDENEDQSNDLDRTIVNEELVMNLTQNPLNVTLQEEDYELLRIMKELEENEGQALDDDSALAQCSQLPRAETNENNKIFTQVKDIEEEDEDELDFTMMNFDPDSQEELSPQDLCKKWCVQLQSPERPVRQSSLKDMLDFFQSEKVNEKNAESYYNDLYIHLLKAYSDRFEVCRSLAASVVSALMNHLPKNSSYLEYICSVLAQRLAQAEMIEESEEMRLQLVQQLIQLVKKFKQNSEDSDKEDLILKAYNDIIDILIRTIKDPYPAIQKESCEVVKLLAAGTPSFRYRAEVLIKPMTFMLSHRFSANRTIAIETMSITALHIFTNDDKVGNIIMDLSKLLMDDVPSVRRECGRAGIRLGLELKDRYSHFSKILPLILCCLTDEVESVREEMQEGWERVGAQYYEENANDLKEYELTDVPPDNYPSEIKRPTFGCRQLVQRNLKMVNVILHEMEEWKENVRLHSTRLLGQVVIHSEKLFATQFIDTYPVLAKTCVDPEKIVAAEALLIAIYLGTFLDYSTWGDFVRRQTTKHPNLGNLKCFTVLFAAAPNEEKLNDLQEISETLCDSNICHNDKPEYQLQLLQFVDILSEALLRIKTEKSEESSVSEVERNLYTIAMKVMCLSAENNEIQTLGYEVLQKISTFSYTSVEDLHQRYISYVLNQIEGLDIEVTEVIESILFLSGYIRISGLNLSNIAIYQPHIIVALKNTCPEGQILTFKSIAEVMLKWSDKSLPDGETQDELPKLESFIKEVISPYLIWHAGQSAETVRTMATACLCSTVQGTAKNISQQLIETFSGELIPLIEDCSIRTRAYAIRALLSAGPLEPEKLKPLIFQVLARLDDPCAEVRELAATCLGHLKPKIDEERKQEWYSTIDQVIERMILHLESPEEKLKELLAKSLKIIGQDFDEDESDDFASKTRNKDLTTALENLTANFPQFDGGYDLRSTKSGSENRTKNISMQNKTWFNKNQPPKLQELKISVEKLKSNETSSNLNCTPTNNDIKKEEISNIFSFDTNFLNKIISSPIPGPSGVQKTDNSSTAHVTPEKFQSHVSPESDESEDDPLIQSFYDRTLIGTFAILDTLDLIGRTCELAKLFGIQFYEVLSRGSQFRVESMMMRIAKARNYVGVSPSVQQRAHMRAPEYLPLILEPQSRLFTDPLIVLDFQSLYPSVIIGYNYCFSTCLGRVEHLGTKDEFEFGATKLKISPDIIDQLVEQNQITISPCGVAFVTPDVRKGVLPQMLKEILDTRLMVKQSMKIHKTNKVLQRVLHSRQLGLKLIANVTYGYTAANFSGRMPCVEVGDSVVSKGRETLERAIKFVEANKEWRAEVVYGDTDSLFILLPGRDRASAFIIGQEIAEAVTEDNPTPIKLKFEKVYQPCILQTKKRYVGYIYETPDQIDPIYEAKGIETVRRDGCPIVAKTLEKTLRILFETLDVSAVKRYINRQFTKILRDEISIQDLIFAKEFRGMNGYKPGACVPAMELTKKWIQKDPRNIPLSGERVPFVIANGPPGLPLIRLVRSPYELLADKALKINSFYYITKVLVPPLNRCLLLIGADVREWLSDLPRITKLTGATTTTDGSLVNFNYKKSTIAQYFATTNCIVECGNQTVKPGFCTECLSNPQKSVVKLTANMMMLDRKMHQIEKICQSCCARSIHYECISLDCPVLYKLNTSKHNFTQIETLREFLETEFF